MLRLPARIGREIGGVRFVLFLLLQVVELAVKAFAAE
jgi:hypothetical protein